MLHTQSEEDSSAARGMGRDFFQNLPENNREYSPGLFPQEVRKELPTFAQKLGRIRSGGNSPPLFLHKE